MNSIALALLETTITATTICVVMILLGDGDRVRMLARIVLWPLQVTLWIAAVVLYLLEPVSPPDQSDTPRPAFPRLRSATHTAAHASDPYEHILGIGPKPSALPAGQPSPKHIALLEAQLGLASSTLQSDANDPCPVCGTAHVLGGVYCQQCGYEWVTPEPPAPHVLLCAACARHIPEDSRRCPFCGRIIPQGERLWNSLKESEPVRRGPNLFRCRLCGTEFTTFRDHNPGSCQRCGSPFTWSRVLTDVAVLRLQCALREPDTDEHPIVLLNEGSHVWASPKPPKPPASKTAQRG